jgi:hypothetical protein
MKRLTFTRRNESYDFEHADSDAFLCGQGVMRMFPSLPELTTSVEFVFTKDKTHAQAYKITWECEYNNFVNWTEASIMYNHDYELALDGIETPMYCDAIHLMADLWEEGYNYVRAEYVA